MKANDPITEVEDIVPDYIDVRQKSENYYSLFTTKAFKKGEIVLENVERISHELEKTREGGDKLNSEKTKLQSEIQRLTDHIILLTGQNKELSEELRIICDRDEQIIKQTLARKDRVGTLLRGRHNEEEQPVRNNRNRSPGY